MVELVGLSDVVEFSDPGCLAIGRIYASYTGAFRPPKPPFIVTPIG